jgi:hypothetical protein
MGMSGPEGAPACRGCASMHAFLCVGEEKGDIGEREKDLIREGVVRNCEDATELAEPCPCIISPRNMTQWPVVWHHDDHGHKKDHYMGHTR